MSTWIKGRSLEDTVCEYLKPYDKRVRHEKGSGNCGNSGDIRNDLDLVIECKNHAGKNINVPIEVYDKVLRECPTGRHKTPMVIRQIDDGRIFVVMELKHFVNDFVDEVYEKDL